MRRQLVAYSGDEKLACSIPFSEDRIPLLRHLFNTEDDEQMVLVYHVAPEMRDKISRILARDLDPSLDYFIETFS